MNKQAEAEVVPSSSLIEVYVEVEVGVEVKVQVEVEVEVGVEVGVVVGVEVAVGVVVGVQVEVGKLSFSTRFILLRVVVGWVGRRRNED